MWSGTEKCACICNLKNGQTDRGSVKYDEINEWIVNNYQYYLPECFFCIWKIRMKTDVRGKNVVTHIQITFKKQLISIFFVKQK